MARIIYGVMGDSGGHVNRARIIADQLHNHEFLFVGGGRVMELRAGGYAVQEVPCLATLYRNNQVDIPSTVSNALKVLLGRGTLVRRLASIIESFDPDIILTDYEYFVPLAARALGRYCVSVDHQHVLTHCAYDPPPGQLMNRLMTNTVIAKMYSKADRFVVTSYFHLEPIDPSTTKVFPPILRRDVTGITPSLGEHVLVYQTSPTFHRLFPVLESLGSRFLVYGFGKMTSRGNIFFKQPSRAGFLEDLASCRYVICNGSHNVISEALFLGKPVFSFPIAKAYEQFMNAYFLAKLRYGDYSTDPNPSAEIFRSFESKLESYQENIKGQEFFGNPELIGYLESLIGVVQQV